MKLSSKRKKKGPTSLLNKRCPGDIDDVSVSVGAAVFVSMVDDIFCPCESLVTCFHPILKILLPCLVSLYPFFEAGETIQNNN